MSVIAEGNLSNISVTSKTGYLNQRRIVCAYSFPRGLVLKLSNVSSLNICLIGNNCLMTSKYSFC